MRKRKSSSISSFWASLRNERGNVMISFAILVSTVFTIAASGMELANINASKAHLQAANDAAALTAAKKFSESKSLDIEEAKKSLYTNIAARNLEDIDAELSLENIDGIQYVRLKTDAKYNTVFAGILAQEQINVHADTYVLTQAKKVEIAFVLDTTGSLAWNGRIDSLKSAMSTTFDILAATQGDVKFGIVPFNTAVKLNPNLAETMFEWGQAERKIDCKNNGNYPDYCKVAQFAVDALCVEAIDRFDCHSKVKFYHKLPYNNDGRNYYEMVAKSYEQSGSGYKVFTRTLKYSKSAYCWGYSCSNDLSLDTDIQYDLVSQANLNQYNAVPSGMSLSNMKYEEDFDTSDGFTTPPESELIYQALNSPAQRIIAFPNNLQSQWGGCIIDRNMNYDISAESPNAAVADSLYPARSCDSSPYLPQILPLTDNIQAGRDTANSITPNGYTNITIGVQWGMELLSPTEPLTGAVPFFDHETRKIMIVITDGDNTRNRYTSNTSEIDFRTKQACQAAKQKGIEVFTVRLEDGNENLLKNCASSPENFFDVKQASNLTAAMQAIMTKVSKLRIAR